MFTRRRARRRSGKRIWGGVNKFASRFPGGKRITQVPFAQVYFTKHAYNQTLNNTNIALFSLFAYQPTSLFNVDLSGDDAAFAASLNQFWTTYVVLGFSYEVSFVNRETGDDLTLSVVPWPTIDDPTSLREIEYRAGSKSVLISEGDSGNNIKSISGYVNVSSLFGMKVVNEATFWADGTTEPTTRPQLYCGVTNNLGNTTTGTFKIKMQLYVKWFNRKDAGEPTSFGPAAMVEGNIASLKAHIDKMDLVVAEKVHKRQLCVKGKCVVE